MHLVWLRIIDYTLSTNQINTSRRRGASAGWWCRSTQSRARGPLFHRRSARHEQGICQVRTSHLLRDGGGKVRLVVRALFLCAECGGARVCRSRSRGGRCPPPPRHRDGKMQRGRRRGCSPHILHRPLTLFAPQDDWVALDKAYWRNPEGPGTSYKYREHHPVVHVSHRDAAEYCKWVGKRLPGEREWEAGRSASRSNRKTPMYCATANY